MENSYLHNLFEDETAIIYLSKLDHYKTIEEYNVAIDQIELIKNVLRERIPINEIDHEFINQVIEELDVDVMHSNILINSIFENNLRNEELNEVLDELGDEYFKINLTLNLIINYLNYDLNTSSRDIAITELDSLEKVDSIVIPSQLDYDLPNEELIIRSAYEVTLDCIELINDMLADMDYQDELNQEFIKDLTNLKQVLNIIYIYLSERTKIMNNPTDNQLREYLSQTFNIIAIFTKAFKIVENLFKNEEDTLEDDILSFINSKPIINYFDDSMEYVKDIETGAQLPDAIKGLIDDMDYFLSIIDSITDEVGDALEKEFLKTLKKVLTRENNKLRKLYMKSDEHIKELGLKNYIEELSLNYNNLMNVRLLLEAYLPSKMDQNLEIIALSLLDLEELEEPVYEYENKEKIESIELQYLVNKAFTTIQNVLESKKLLETKFVNQSSKDNMFKLTENLDKIYGYATSVYNYLSEYDEILEKEYLQQDIKFHLNILLASLNFVIRANTLFSYLNNPNNYQLKDECIRFIEKWADE
ncbi:MAG: hypothetical protein E7Z84_05680 [Methanosphaera stadtmanae]|nr:hypothetical protein [Methanosphaera stadtmanae]